MFSFFMLLSGCFTMMVRFPFFVSFAVFLFGLFATLDGCAQEDISSADSQVPVQSESVKSSTTAEVGSTPGVQKQNIFYSGTVIASDPSILKMPTGYVMFYTDLDTRKNRTVIAKAVSPDGVNWQTQGSKIGIGGLVISGQDGAWDENVESAAVVRANGQWSLFFSGYRDAGTPFKGFPAALWLARSDDGNTFTRVSAEPILQPTKGWYDNDAVYSPTIMYENGTYYMIYVGHAYTDTSKIAGGGVFLLSATSVDGVNWKKNDRPVARPGQFADWRREGLAEPYLVKKSANEYLLFYTGLQGEKRSIGVATAPSIQGPWSFGKTPILKAGERGAPDEHQVLAPAVLIEGGKVRLWFLGADSKEMLRIGYAEGTVDKMVSESR